MASPFVHKPSLLSGWHVFMIASGSIIGAGLFVGTSAAIAGAGPAVLISYAVAALLTTIMMRMLYILYCHSTGEMNFLAHLQNQLGHNFACLGGWLYVFLWSVTAAAQAVGGGIILGGVLGIKASLWSLILMGFGLILNLLPIRFFGHCESFLSSIKFIILLLFFAPCLIWIANTPQSAHIIRANLTSHGGFMPLGVVGVAGVIPMIIQDFTGCETAFLACRESHNPSDNMRTLTRWLPLFITSIYMTCVLAIVALIPWDHIKPGTSPFASTLSFLGWRQASLITTIMTLVAIISCLNSAQYVISRTLQSLAQIKGASPKLTYRNRYGVPTGCVVLGSATALIPVLLACGAPTQFYSALLDTSGNMILIIWAMICLAGAKAAQAAHKKAHQYQGLVAFGLMMIIFTAIVLMPSTSLTGLSAIAIAIATWIGTKSLLKD